MFSIEQRKILSQWHQWSDDLKVNMCLKDSCLKMEKVYFWQIENAIA